MGILPAGALGVAFAFHLTAGFQRLDGTVFFLEREGSASGRALSGGRAIHLAEGKTIADESLFRPTLPECLAQHRLPEILLVCTQPDQVHGVVSSWVRVLETLHASIGDAAAGQLPILVLASNGIYFQRVRQFLLEKLEESTLLGRLPDLWPDLMPRLVGRMMRGVTIQTGLREGEGSAAVYRPGVRGITRLAGGDAVLRTRVAARLSELGGWFETIGEVTPTRAEFDKALVNLSANLLGQLAAIDEQGVFHRLTVAEIVAAQPPDAIRELVGHVLAVGKAVRAFREEESIDVTYDSALERILSHAQHVPSSLQWIESCLRRGTLQPRLTPTEAWLMEPLIRYAHAAGVESAAHYFEDLSRQVERRLARAIAHSATAGGKPESPGGGK